MSEQNPGPVQEKVILPGSKNENGKAKNFFRNLWKVLSNNWIMKLVCLLLAVLLWGFIYSQDDTLTREKVFQNVPVRLPKGYVNSLEDGKPVITDWNEGQTVTVRVDVPQKYYDDLTENSFAVYPDVSSLRVPAGEGPETVKVKLICDIDSSRYGGYTIETEKISLKVDEYVVRPDVSVGVNLFGAPPEGAWRVSGTVEDPVTLSGPRSLVDRVSWVSVDASTGTLRKGTDRQVVNGNNVRLYDAEDHDITAVADDPMFKKPDSLRVTALIDRVKVFENVPVQLPESNVNSLKNKGWVISGMDDSRTVTVRVNVPRDLFGKLTVNDITVRPDTGSIPKLAVDGSKDVAVGLVCDFSREFYSPAYSIDDGEIVLNVEQYGDVRDMVVNACINGAAPEGYRVTGAAVSDRINVSGPCSVVDRIFRIDASVNMRALKRDAGEQTVRSTSISLYDESGNEIDASGLTLTVGSRSVSFMNVTIVLEKIPDDGEAAE